MTAAEEIDFGKYKYSKTWFLSSQIRRSVFDYICDEERNGKMEVLEIGCYEGLSSVFFAHYFLNHPESSLTCVDPFLSVDGNDHESLLQSGEEQNFDYNVSVCKNGEKIRIYKITSDTFFSLTPKVKRYNLIYIDGSHNPEFVKRDVQNGFAVLKKNGIMWMDDYLGGSEGDRSIQKAMDEALKPLVESGECEIIYSGYQLAIRRIA